MPVQWGDMDSLGHVNNSRYFTWFETARIALFERVGLANVGTSLTQGPILAHIECTFRKPVHHPATVTCAAGVRAVGNTSFVLGHAVLLDDQVVAQGDGVIVLVDYTSGAKIPVPPSMRADLEALVLPT